MQDSHLISPIDGESLPAVLALNNDHAAELSWLEPERLSFLVGQAFYARRIGEVDAFSAPMLVHTDAIYIHDGQQYHVDELDWDEKKAYVKPVNVEHYTDASLSVRVEVIEQSNLGLAAARNAGRGAGRHPPGAAGGHAGAA